MNFPAPMKEPPLEIKDWLTLLSWGSKVALAQALLDDVRLEIWVNPPRPHDDDDDKEILTAFD